MSKKRADKQVVLRLALIRKFPFSYHRMGKLVKTSKKMTPEEIKAAKAKMRRLERIGLRRAG